MAKGIWINERDFMSFADRNGNSLFQQIATRAGAIDFLSLGMYLPDPDPVLRKMGKDQRVYRELASDARVGANIISRKSGVLSMLWGIDRGKSKTRPAKEIETLFKRLPVNRILSEILDAAIYGYQPLEVLWKTDGRLILPEAVMAKPREWFAFSADNELLLRTRSNPNGMPVPERKFLCPVYNPSSENPYGERTISRVFWPVTFKRGGLKFWVNFCEKYGTPWVVGKMPRGTEKAKIDELAAMLEAMITDAVAVIPDDSSVEIIEAAGKSASSDLHKALVEWCNSEISTAILGHAGNSEATPGRLGEETAALDAKKEIVDADKNLVIETVNQLIGWIYELNFGGGEPPSFEMWEEEDVDLDLAERDKALSESFGGRKQFSAKYYQRAYGFEEGDIEDTPNPLPAGSEFSSPRNFAAPAPAAPAAQSFPDQDAIDEAVEALPAEQLQAQMQGMLKPVIERLEKGSSYEEILTALSEAYPDLRDDAIEKMLERAIFVTETWGRLNAGKD
jgi:phage gp29-like protein